MTLDDVSKRIDELKEEAGTGEIEVLALDSNGNLKPVDLIKIVLGDAIIYS